MKKIILYLLGVVLLTSCIKKPEFQYPTAQVTYSFDAADDMGDLFGFTATYTDPDNHTVSEKIVGLPWRKQIVAKIPFDARLEIGFEAKKQFPDREIYNVGFEGRIERLCKLCGNPIHSKTANDDGKLLFSVKLPDGVSPNDVTMSVAPLKYDKHFAFTFTVDDASENGWSRIFQLIHGKWIDDDEFFHLGNTPTTGYLPRHTLAVTDGCRNERRFGFGEAITPNFRNPYNKYEPRIQETSQQSVYITWEELRIMLDFGCFVHFHNVDGTKYDELNASQIAQGFKADYDKVVEKLGRKMKVLALPDGSKEYIEAASSFPQIAFIRSSLSADRLIYLKDCGSLKGLVTYGGESTSIISEKLSELALQAASDNPYWVGLTVHRPQADYMDMFNEIYDRYGRYGADNIWVASWDEVYEYQEFRSGSTIEKSVQDRTVTFEVDLPDHPDFTFRELSFLIHGVGRDCDVEPLSGNIYGLSHAVRNGDLLVNVNFDPELPARAEKYTARYEASYLDVDKDDAKYIVSMLTPDLAAPFLARIEHTELPLTLNGITINQGANTTYSRDIRIGIDSDDPVASYRIGESPDISDLPLFEYTGSPVDYTLSEGYGEKTVYVQAATGKIQSNVVSASILYADVPESGKIDREAVNTYVKKYDGHILTVEKKFSDK